MNVIYISPQFPPNYKYFVFALRDAGAKVFGIGDTPAWEVGEDVRGALAEYIQVPDMYNRYDDLKRAVASIQDRYGPIHRIDSNNEHWLEHEARIREDFNITGQRTSDLRFNRSKLGMKDYFRKAGVMVAPAEKVQSLQQCKAFVEKHGFPVVLKPDTGVGAAGARKVRDMAQLEAALSPVPDNTCIEAFIRGTIVTFDGLADREGRIMHCTSHEYSSGIMEIVTDRLIFHYYSYRDLPADLEKAGTDIVRAFNVRERFFHIEFFRTPEGKYYALEINVRPPGGYTTDMMNYAADIDLYKVWARLLVHGEQELKYERRFHVAHVGRRDGHSYKLDHHGVMSQIDVAFIHHPPMPELWKPVMGDSVYLIGDPDLNKLKTAIARLEER
jgi:hypothetical protein